MSYEDAKVEFSGSPEVVMRSLHEFVSKVIPNMDLARTISVNYSLNDLIQMFRDYIRITEEGPRVWAQDKKLSDKDLVSLQETDENGRIAELAETLEPGEYRLVFYVGGGFFEQIVSDGRLVRADEEEIARHHRDQARRFVP